jgi:hypothetical protein
MEIGELVKWWWHLGTGWGETHFTGMVVSSHLAKTDYEKVRILKVLANDGTVLDVREDEASLERMR